MYGASCVIAQNHIPGESRLTDHPHLLNENGTYLGFMVFYFKISHLNYPVFIHKKIGRLQVPMHNRGMA